jgi:Ser/Thr protein kinase RdoA (MazF antagonist)
MPLPTEQDAITIIQTIFQRDVNHIQRFPTGLCHYVYGVVTNDQQRVVVRIARRETQALLAGGVYWSRLLRSQGVPLPALLYADLEATIVPFAFMVLEQVPGQDLHEVYRHLSRPDKQVIAVELARIQARVQAALPPGAGFGCATSLEETPPHRTWIEVIEQSLDDSRRQMAQAGVVDLQHVEQVQQRLARFRPYLAQVEPTPFLDDTTTKNVLIHNRRLAGLVDVDEICYGDPLWVIAQTQMALLKPGEDLDYIAAWTDHLQLTAEQCRVLQFYTAVCCATFLSELGHAFNKDQPEPVDERLVRHLIRVLDDLLAD